MAKRVKQNFNLAFIAFLAWMAALMVVVILQGCVSYDAHNQYNKAIGNTECAAYN